MKFFRKKIKKILFYLIVLIFIYFLPFLIIYFKNKEKIVFSLENLPQNDVVIVFGTIVNDKNEISPLLKERLDAGIKILEDKKTEKIVVSNTEKATQIMANYLYEKNVSKEKVELDIQADKTPDTCRFEKEKHPENRQVIFVSQNFHLPRLIYQCEKVGVKGIGFAPEKLNLIDRSQQSFTTKIFTRTQRYFREAGLTWLAILGIYE